LRLARQGAARLGAVLRQTASLVWPQAVAGNSREAIVGIACLILLGAIFVAEMVTPDLIISSLIVVPLMVAMWALSTGWATTVAATVAASLTLAIVLDEANRLSLLVFALTCVAVAVLTRLCAERLTVVLAQASQRKGDVSTLATRSEFGPLPDGISSLSRRELEVAQLASSGYTALQIAGRLHISGRTVESHLASTYERLGIHSRLELMRMATELKGYAASVRTPASV
jgi:DNA-binding CsgD family transcriptional regulator